MRVDEWWDLLLVSVGTIGTTCIAVANQHVSFLTTGFRPISKQIN